MTFSVTCPAEDAAGYNQGAEVLAAADQGGNGGGSSGEFRCTGSPQTVQVTATASISTSMQGGYAAGQAFVGGTLFLSSPGIITGETGQDVIGDVAAIAGVQTITEGTAAS